MMLPSRRVVPLRTKKSLEQYLWRAKESLDFAWAVRAAARAGALAGARAGAGVRFVIYMEVRGEELWHHRQSLAGAFSLQRGPPSFAQRAPLSERTNERAWAHVLF